MRCQNCQKFTSLETECESVDSEDLSCDEKGWHLTFDVTVNRNCQDCGDNMKQLTYSFDKEGEWPKEFKYNAEESLYVEFADPEIDEGGGGRYKKNMITVRVPFEIYGNADKPIINETVENSEAASSFEELY